MVEETKESSSPVVRRKYPLYKRQTTREASTDSIGSNLSESSVSSNLNLKVRLYYNKLSLKTSHNQIYYSALFVVI